MTGLNDNQTKAIQKLSKLKVGALFMEPGTGKTLTAIKLIESTESNLVIFLVPFQTKDNLKKELDKWKFRMNYEIIGIETLSSSDRTFMHLFNKIKRHKNTFLVVDESLKIKNSESIRSRRILKLSRLVEYKLILNGTPISKNLKDLWPQMEFLSPKILNMTERQFIDTFIKYKVIDIKGRPNIKKITGNVNIDYLYSLIEPYVFECKLVIEPEERKKEIDYEVSTETDLEYNSTKQLWLNRMFDLTNGIQFLAMCQQLQQSYSIDRNKLNAIKNIVDKKTIIFVKFVKTKEVLQESYPKALVMTYGKGALGLNLQQYNKVIFFDKTFDYSQMDQARHRIYRIGQKENVTCYNLTGNLGLEKIMNKNINKKTTLLDVFKKASIKEKERELIESL